MCRTHCIDLYQSQKGCQNLTTQSNIPQRQTVPGDSGCISRADAHPLELASVQNLRVYEPKPAATVWTLISKAVTYIAHRLHSHITACPTFRRNSCNQWKQIIPHPLPNSNSQEKKKEKEKQRSKATAWKSMVMPEMENSCEHIPRGSCLLGRSHPRIKLNSYCPSFVHLTSIPECSGLLRLHLKELTQNWYKNSCVIICWRAKVQNDVVLGACRSAPSLEAVSISCRLCGTTVRSQDGGSGLGMLRIHPSLPEFSRQHPEVRAVSCTVCEATAAAFSTLSSTVVVRFKPS